MSHAINGIAADFTITIVIFSEISLNNKCSLFSDFNDRP